MWLSYKPILFININKGTIATIGGAILTEIIQKDRSLLLFILNLLKAYAAKVPSTMDMVTLEEHMIKLFFIYCTSGVRPNTVE